jgi:small-conductance mechanosensitive channel
VPLSEHEQRLLEQMERALHAEDPKFASALQGTRVRSRLRRRVLVAGLGVLVGAALIGYGVVAHRVALDIAGAAVAVACAWMVWTTWRRVPAPGQIVPTPRLRRPRAGRRPGTFMQRMELRWQHRRERDGL